MREVTEFLKPIKKGICVECNSRMVKIKDKWRCLKCGLKIEYIKRKWK